MLKETQMTEMKISQATKDRLNLEGQSQLSVYADNGYSDRFSYLESLAEGNDVPLDQLIVLADVLGPEEDFDALVVATEDFGRYN